MIPLASQQCVAGLASHEFPDEVIKHRFFCACFQGIPGLPGAKGVAGEKVKHSNLYINIFLYFFVLLLTFSLSFLIFPTCLLFSI